VSVVLDDTLLARYAETFCGYGRYDAPYWFVGLEEGSDGTVEARRGALPRRAAKHG
jgi:hypothetical protein